MNKVVGVDVDGHIEWHAINSMAGADYDTMCGVDAHDSVIGHMGTVVAKKGQKITCSQCYEMWKGVMSLKLTEGMFEVEG